MVYRLQAIAVNVMFLNLRNINGRAEPTDFAPSLPELNFTQNRFLGNIGAPVEPEQWDDLDVFEEQLETSGTEDWTATSTAFTADADVGLIAVSYSVSHLISLVLTIPPLLS